MSQRASTNSSALTIVPPLVGKHDIYVGIKWASEEQEFGGITFPELDPFGRTIRPARIHFFSHQVHIRKIWVKCMLK